MATNRVLTLTESEIVMLQEVLPIFRSGEFGGRVSGEWDDLDCAAESLLEKLCPPPSGCEVCDFTGFIDGEVPCICAGIPAAAQEVVRQDRSLKQQVINIQVYNNDLVDSLKRMKDSLRKVQESYERQMKVF